MRKLKQEKELNQIEMPMKDYETNLIFIFNEREKKNDFFVAILVFKWKLPVTATIR